MFYAFSLFLVLYFPCCSPIPSSYYTVYSLACLLDIFSISFYLLSHSSSIYWLVYYIYSSDCKVTLFHFFCWEGYFVCNLFRVCILKPLLTCSVLSAHVSHRTQWVTLIRPAFLVCVICAQHNVHACVTIIYFPVSFFNLAVVYCLVDYCDYFISFSSL